MDRKREGVRKEKNEGAGWRTDETAGNEEKKEGLGRTRG
jgi:hypothetical protein